MKQLSLMIIFLFALAILTHAQNERKFVRQGNKYYGAALKDTTKIDSTLFNKAEIEYRKALDKKPTDPKWNFNLSNSLYKQMKFEESAEKFKEISEQSTDKVEKSHALHNMGNSLLMNNKLDESIEAYKQALRNNPKDLETKYNLLYAMNLKKKQEEEQKKQDKNKDQDKDKDKDKDQNKDQDKKDQDQQKQDQQQQPQNKISKQNAEQMLQALENQEKKTQEKVKKVQALKAKSKQVEKDW
jgi:tetratricopeptide (TPR) repeat protein